MGRGTLAMFHRTLGLSAADKLNKSIRWTRKPFVWIAFPDTFRSILLRVNYAKQDDLTRGQASISNWPRSFPSNFLGAVSVFKMVGWDRLWGPQISKFERVEQTHTTMNTPYRQFVIQSLPSRSLFRFAQHFVLQFGKNRTNPEMLYRNFVGACTVQHTHPNCPSVFGGFHT